MSVATESVPNRRGGQRGGLRGVVWVVALVALGLVAVVLARPTPGARPYDARSVEPSGARALVLLLEEYGAAVTITDVVPASGDQAVVLVLDDRLRNRQRDALLTWVEQGGRLVVADPDSTLHAGAGTDGGAQDVFGVVARGRCTIAELDGLRRVDTGFGLEYPIAPSDASCFGDEAHAFVLRVPQGAGALTAVGSAEPFTNDLLDEEDGAALALSLLLEGELGRRVVVLEGAVAGAGDDGLLSLVSPKVWQMLAMFGVAFLVVALWRGRRLGRPISEPVPVEIPGSELVLARADLLRRAGQPGRAAVALRADLHRELCDRFGVPRDAPLALLDAAASARTDAAPGAVLATLVGPDVVDERGLAALADAVDALRAATAPEVPA